MPAADPAEVKAAALDALATTFRNAGLQTPPNDPKVELHSAEFEMSGEMKFDVIWESLEPNDQAKAGPVIDRGDDKDVDAYAKPLIEEMCRELDEEFREDPSRAFPFGNIGRRSAREAVRTVRKCHTCEGSGAKQCAGCNGHGTLICANCSGGAVVACRRCGGRGIEVCYRCNGNAQIWNGSAYVNCSSCSGTGWEYGCYGCNSTGVVQCSCGNGHLACGSCRATGQQTCTTCSGHKRITRVQRLSVSLSINFKIARTGGDKDAWKFFEKKVVDLVIQESTYRKSIQWQSLQLVDKAKPLKFEVKGSFCVTRIESTGLDACVVILCADSPDDAMVLESNLDASILKTIKKLDLSRKSHRSKVQQTDFLRRLQRVALGSVTEPSKYNEDKLAEVMPSYENRGLPLMRRKVARFLCQRRSLVSWPVVFLSIAAGLYPVLALQSLKGIPFGTRIEHVKRPGFAGGLLS